MWWVIFLGYFNACVNPRVYSTPDVFLAATLAPRPLSSSGGFGKALQTSQLLKRVQFELQRPERTAWPLWYWYPQEKRVLHSLLDTTFISERQLSVAVQISPMSIRTILSTILVKLNAPDEWRPIHASKALNREQADQLIRTAIDFLTWQLGGHKPTVDGLRLFLNRDRRTLSNDLKKMNIHLAWKA